MFVTDEAPSGIVDMLALSRVVVCAPDWASPISGSPSCHASVFPKLLDWAFQFCSVKPRKYEK